jgi:hypothetical protein
MQRPSMSVETWRVAYEETSKVAMSFWEWRHKVMTFFFTGIAGLAVFASWIYTHGLGKAFLALPPFLGGLGASIAFFLDWRIATVLDEIYISGRSLEEQAEIPRGVFTGIHDRARAKHQPVRMATVLRSAYLLVSVLLLALGVLELCKPIRAHQPTRSDRVEQVGPHHPKVTPNRSHSVGIDSKSNSRP